MEKRYCYNCNQEQEVVFKKVSEVFDVKGQKILATITICECSVCHEEIFDKSLEKENERIVFDLYRKKMGLLSPEDIRSIRNSYNLSQSSFAKLLGFGLKTITRYENGSIQDVAHDILIRLMDNRFCFSKVFDLRKNEISAKEANDLKRKIDNLSFSTDYSASYECNINQPCLTSDIEGDRYYA